MADFYLYENPDDQADEVSIAGRPLRDLVTEIQDLYLEDRRPWVIGFSGGKDSTAVVQLIYFALKSLPKSEHKKPIFIVSSNTLVETPLVIDLLTTTLDEINHAALIDSLPIEAHVVIPLVEQSFWVNLLGKGYPAPTRSFRWCTERMKINPISAFVFDRVAEFGEVIMVLGARSAESASRAQVIAKHRVDGTRLGRHTSLPNAYVYTPIDDWTADEVWEYLMSAPRPWGGSNEPLFELYKGSNAGECPIVIDTSTPSCGNSRFGCWTCTVVTKDKAVESLVEQGESWMRPLLDFRNMLAETTKPKQKAKYRNVRRRSGKISIMRDSLQEYTQDTTEAKKTVPGSYWMHYRRDWLEQLLRIQKKFNESGRDLELIRDDELHLIRKEWINDPNEPDHEDHLPKIYREVFGEDLNWVQSDAASTNRFDFDLIESLAEEYQVPKVLVHKLLDIEISLEGLAQRRGLLRDIDKTLNQDWGSIEDILEKDKLIRDGGYTEEIKEMQEELETLVKATS
ncbi:MAG: DNA phosphorothioation system sulfurtransferase DndC [Gammaproteobacteria bacterium]|nr:DNA phosphorothioation system sulfurtransferase DndC [Gammaproteobacteria bacterium]